MISPTCRSCFGTSGHVVLDLGTVPACDYFPDCDDPGPDPRYPLRMWLCSTCGLSQLDGDDPVAEEPRGSEPRALVEQAADAVDRLATAGWLVGRSRVAEFGSPHGGSWLDLVARRGLTPVPDGDPADLVIDSFGMMHAPNQAAALDERVARVAPGGALVLQYHSLGTIIRRGQWNALRHGHFAYYSTNALITMLAARGFVPGAAWLFDLYGGTLLLVATRRTDPSVPPPDRSVTARIAEEDRIGVCDPGALAQLQVQAEAHTAGVRDWLAAQQRAGRGVLGYGAASRAVALLCRAKVDRCLLPGVVDASSPKHGRRMPGTDIPIIAPTQLIAGPPQNVLLFVPDLLAEVRRAFPDVEAAGGRWVDAESLHA